MDEPLPLAEVVEEKRRFSFVWIVPLVALMIALGMVYRSYTQQGPEIQIRFDNAEGVMAGKTRVKYRDVEIGQVTQVRFTPDFRQVEVTARLDPGLESLLGEGSRFWIVRPRIGLSGASGINTLVSGVHIAMDPDRKGEKARRFVGLEEPPKVLSDAKGRLFQLRAERLGSLSVGSPVYYRQVKVGEVTGYRLAPEGDHVAIDLFIDAPHDRLVKANTRFWKVSGLSMALTSEGVQVQMESLAALVAGGIAFGHFEGLGPGGPVAEGTWFDLYESRQASETRKLGLTVPYLLYFEDSVRGLRVGAPVEFRGIRVGTVKAIALERDPKSEAIRIPVLIALEPERVPLGEADPAHGRKPDEARFRRLMERLVARGLRARLKTGNLLTGQLIVDFAFDPQAEPATIDDSGPYPVLPTAPAPLRNLMASAGRLVDKLEALPWESLGAHLASSAQGLDRLLNDPRLGQSLDHLEALLATLERRGGPLLDELDQLSGDLRQLTGRARQTLDFFERAASEQGAMGGELVRALQALTAAARAVRSAADYLERHPEALLQGKVR